MTDEKKTYTKIGFGKHKGRTVWDCPEHYLRWMVSQTARTDHFRQLQREAQDPLACADDADQANNPNGLRYDIW